MLLAFRKEAGYRKILSCMGLLLVLAVIGGSKGGMYFYLPLFVYGAEEKEGQKQEERETQPAEVIYYIEASGEEGSEPEQEEKEHLSASGEVSGQLTEADASMEELLLQENSADFFVTPQKQVQYDFGSYADYETLLSSFYTIDAYALAGNDLFNINDLLNRDMSMEKDASAPQILIYHTHSREAFADSVPGERSDTIVGVGDELTRILTEDYGYNVLHHTAQYDTVRDEAYGNSLPEITRLLEENPSIQVVIDLHRDAGGADRATTMDVNGKKTARFMFFNGISRSRKNGDIAYLYNPNLKGNLAFSFQMQAFAGEYYPGLTRRIYIKQYRFNMHLKERTLLIELGDENNTVQEAKNACYPIAHLLDLVLSGQTP